MPEQVPDSVKNERSNVLLELADKMSNEYRNLYIGKRVKVLVEEKRDIYGCYTGYTDNYIRVNIFDRCVEHKKHEESGTQAVPYMAETDSNLKVNRIVCCEIDRLDGKTGELFGHIL